MEQRCRLAAVTPSPRASKSVTRSRRGKRARRIRDSGDWGRAAALVVMPISVAALPQAVYRLPTRAGPPMNEMRVSIKARCPTSAAANSSHRFTIALVVAGDAA